MGRNRAIKQLHPDLIAELRTLSSEVPDICTPSEAWVWVRPITKRGYEILQKTFWALLRDDLAWRKEMSDEAAQRLARWVKLRRERELSAGGDWPPIALTRTYYGQPTPWDGKDEKRGTI